MKAPSDTRTIYCTVYCTYVSTPRLGGPGLKVIEAALPQPQRASTAQKGLSKKVSADR